MPTTYTENVTQMRRSRDVSTTLSKIYHRYPISTLASGLSGLLLTAREKRYG